MAIRFDGLSPMLILRRTAGSWLCLLRDVGPRGSTTEAILYFDSIDSGYAVRVQYGLRVKSPIEAKTFAVRVYEYYDPSVGATARPVEMEVRAEGGSKFTPQG